jgi:hypothetical protein
MVQKRYFHSASVELLKEGGSAGKWPGRIGRDLGGPEAEGAAEEVEEVGGVS